MDGKLATSGKCRFRVSEPIRCLMEVSFNSIIDDIISDLKRMLRDVIKINRELHIYYLASYKNGLTAFVDEDIFFRTIVFNIFRSWILYLFRKTTTGQLYLRPCF